jgi:hypothetical protein
MRHSSARKENDFDIAAVIAGESSGLIRDITSAREVVEGVMREASALLARWSSHTFSEQPLDTARGVP